MLLAGLALGALSLNVFARPSAAVVDACLRTGSVSDRVRYAPLAADAFSVTEDEDAGKITVTLLDGKNTVGTWEVNKPPAFGLLFNGKETPLARVVSLDKRHAPMPFNPYEAMWGVVSEGRESYICATFNFDGLGKSGRFQDVRGLYLIERGTTGDSAFFVVGQVASSGS